MIPPSSYYHSITRRTNDLIDTSERSNMDYVTLSGVCKRTGAEENELAVFMLKELVDNALDFIESHAPLPPPASPSATIITINDNNSSSSSRRGDTELQIHVDITYNPNDKYLIIRVKNSNFGIEDVGFTERRIHSIFGDLNVFHSSKRNQFKISRGMQGDALKEVLCIPYVLATRYRSYSDNNNTVWNEPVIIRNGFGKQFDIRIVVDKIAQHNYADIQKISEVLENNNTGFTEVEAHILYDHRLAYIVSLSDLKKVLIKYALLNTHIGFHFNLVEPTSFSSISTLDNKQATTTTNTITTTTTTPTIMNLPPTQLLLTNTSSSSSKKKRRRKRLVLII
jgi:hypothetical protein